MLTFGITWAVAGIASTVVFLRSNTAGRRESLEGLWVNFALGPISLIAHLITLTKTGDVQNPFYRETNNG